MPVTTQETKLIHSVTVTLPSGASIILSPCTITEEVIAELAAVVAAGEKALADKAKEDR